MKITPWAKEERSTNRFYAFCRIGEGEVMKITHEAEAENAECDLANRVYALMEKFQVRLVDAGEALDMFRAYAAKNLDEDIYQGDPGDEDASAKVDGDGVEFLSEEECDAELAVAPPPMRTPLVERIASDGDIRTRLSPLQKKVIRLCEARQLVLFQCGACEDRPFFNGMDSTKTPCPWCGTEAKPHKHQP